ncbi:MAG TPA: hypothetical protein VF451_09315, partial [Acidobacteriota bacterium]
METLLSPRLKNIILCGLASVLAGAILWLALFPSREMPTTEIKARVDENCRRMEGILEKKVSECLRRSDSLLGAYAAGSLAAADLEKKEALIKEKNGIITDYVGEIFYFRPVVLATGDWRLIKKNQDVYFLRRVTPQAYTVRFFMDFKSNPVQRAAEFPYPVFDLQFSNQPLPSARNDFSYDRAQKRFYYTRVLQPSRNQLVLSLVFSRATLAQHSRRLKKLLAYGLGFLLSLLVFLAFGRAGPLRLGIRLLALAGMAFALWWATAWWGVRNIYFPGAPLPVHSVFQLLVLLVFLLACVRVGGRFVRRKSNTVALLIFNGVALASLSAADGIMRNVDFPFGDFALTAGYLGLLSLLIGLHLAPLLTAAPFMNSERWRRSWPLVFLQAALLVWYTRSFAFPFSSVCLLALVFALWLLRPRPFSMRVLAPLLLLALAISMWLGSYAQQEKKAFISENLKPIFSSQDHYAKLVAREIVYELNSRNTPFPTFFDRAEGDELAECWENTLAARENIASGIYVVAGDGKVLNAFSYQIPYIPLKNDNIFPFWHVEKVAAVLFGKKVSLAAAMINVFQKERYLG